MSQPDMPNMPNTTESAQQPQQLTHALRILTLNSGSSSLKFALYRLNREAPGDPTLSTMTLEAQGSLNDIGGQETTFTVRAANGASLTNERVAMAEQAAALQHLLAWARGAEAKARFEGLAAVGHRIVHGGQQYQSPQRITPQVMETLRSLIPLAPNHLPSEIAAIEAVGKAWPDVPQVACFDTAFHATMPAVAQRFALPRRLFEADVRRYGFHGISYAYICDALQRMDGPAALAGRTIIAHLGSGASMAALRDGQSIDTTMGLTPLGGLVMATRTGDLDPGVLIYLARVYGLSPDALESLLSEQGGMRGISGVSGDMQELLERAPTDAHCAEAIESFCYSARKTVGALAAALGGLDRLVFTGGIGERAAPIRQSICDGLAFLGITLDADRNASNAPIISADTSDVVVRVIPTDEEMMIARYTAETLDLSHIR